MATEIGACLVLGGEASVEDLEPLLADEYGVTVARDRAIICVVGSRLASDRAFRRKVLAAVAEEDPEALVWGASPISVTAVFPEQRLSAAVRSLHDRFFGD